MFVGNYLSELPPGIFDSMTALTRMYAHDIGDWTTLKTVQQSKTMTKL